MCAISRSQWSWCLPRAGDLLLDHALGSAQERGGAGDTVVAREERGASSTSGVSTARSGATEAFLFTTYSVSCSLFVAKSNASHLEEVEVLLEEWDGRVLLEDAEEVRVGTGVDVQTARDVDAATDFRAGAVAAGRRRGLRTGGEREIKCRISIKGEVDRRLGLAAERADTKVELDRVAPRSA